ncbi:hypothetical protein STCU_10628 [Strigomonas culicis]|uniref:Uncharacterized protein n=1 Tax=Strigomonas culicis TaxID=28005 RepID=S9US35_9TRYP|nr:hypothetical protein STCU_10628 [Strigomonas culicis]|eukprot:EPY17416.1 hypothetical protein STCU_10628 [Strigomonas culicis]
MLYYAEKNTILYLTKSALTKKQLEETPAAAEAPAPPRGNGRVAATPPVQSIRCRPGKVKHLMMDEDEESEAVGYCI